MPKSIDFSEYCGYWKDRIERDLASFGDPGAAVDVTRSGRRLRAAWTMRGQEREAVFSISPDRGVNVDCAGRHLPYGSFAAGPDMADLQQVSRMILQASPPRLFVPTQAEHADAAASPPRPALDFLAALLDHDTHDATRVIMVTGEAGAGKTRVLQELVRRRADDYLRGRSSTLLLYVNAQGRALARLNEALATELQDLKVGLTYHSVAVLARLGTLIPVIDGFDELLGVSGYDDAFSSLSGFLEQLEGQGQLLTSARSVYYEEEFLSRAGSMSATGNQAWTHAAVRVRAWSEEDRNEYLDQWAASERLTGGDLEDLRRRMKNVFRRNDALASKPLFFTRMVDLLRNNPGFSAGDDLLRALVQEYLDRERTDKLLDSQSRSLLTTRQFEHLMCELAQEMWNQETRELDYRSVREVAEYVVESEDLSDAAKQVIVERMPTLAFLAKGGGHAASSAGISFEHELFFFYFLAGSIASQFASATTDLKIALSRSALPEDVAERVAAALGASDGVRETGRLQELLDRLARAGAAEWRRATQVRENAGLLVMALLRACANSHGAAHEIDGCVVRSVVFPGSHLRNVTMRRCSLTDVIVQRTDLTSTRFLDCEARDMLLREPSIATGSTRLELKGLAPAQVTSIRFRRDGAMETSYDPAVIGDTLRECGAAVRTDRRRSDTSVPAGYVGLVEQLMRAYRRANPICKDDPALKHIFTDMRWGRVERLLVEHGVVTMESRNTSGKRKQFLRRRFLPERIMSGLRERTDADPRIRAFWRALAMKPPAGG